MNATLRSISIHLRALSAVLLLAGCDGAPTTDGGMSDAGRDASSGMDASANDAGADASAGECTSVTVQTFRLERDDDVSIAYIARIVPTLGGQPWDLHIEFNRYATEYVGEFALGEGDDANYGGCAHCVTAFYSTNLGHGFFAREGTLVTRRDPFSHWMDATLSGVVLEEVNIVGDSLESQPVPGGDCLALAETTITGAFPPPGWRCAPELYGEGEACNCSCGLFDPDCGERCSLPPDPGCDPTPLPVVGCDEGLCTYEGECVATCDYSGRVACTTGVCGFSDVGDRCFVPGEDPVSDAQIGETCAAGERIYPCGVDGEGFAMGLCDVDSDWLCRPACATDDDCTAPETCNVLYFYPATETAKGFCQEPPPPCQETGTTCSDHLDCCSVLCEGLDGRAGSTGTCG